MKAFIDMLFTVSLYAAVLAGLIFLLRALLKKRLSPALRYGLWFLLVLRLALPVTLESGFHLDSLLPAAAAKQADASLAPILMEGAPEIAHRAPDSAPEARTADEAAPVADTAPQAMAAGIDWPLAGFLVWAAGALAFLLRLLWGAAGLAKLRKSLEPCGEGVQAMLADCKRILGVKRDVALRMGAGIPSPLLLPGPCIAMPAAIAERPEALRPALMHELAHVKRGDMAANLLISLLKCAYWFHPPVRLALNAMRQDMESACDAAATVNMNSGERKAYYTLLIDLACTQSNPALGMALMPQGTAHKRVEDAFAPRKTGRGVRALTGAVSLLLLFTCFTTACQPSPPVPPATPIYVEKQIVPAATQPHYSTLGAPLAAPASAGETEEEEASNRLRALGYPAEPESEAMCRFALTLFQRTNGLEQTGELDTKTREALFGAGALPYSVHIGQHGLDVTHIQAKLGVLGLMNKLTRYFGTETEAAVKALQKQSGLGETGVMDAKTQQALDQAVEAAGCNSASLAAHLLVETAWMQLGKKYVHSGKGPDSFDCGGLVYYCLNEIGYHTPYVRATEWPELELEAGTRVTRMEDMLAGDIICFNGHVGIYIGDGQMIDASSSEGKVRICSNIQNSTYWTRNFLCGIRLF